MNFSEEVKKRLETIVNYRMKELIFYETENVAVKDAAEWVVNVILDDLESRVHDRGQNLKTFSTTRCNSKL